MCRHCVTALLCCFRVADTEGVRELGSGHEQIYSIREGRMSGPQPQELLCILGKGALSEIDTWLMEHFSFPFLPSRPPAPSLISPLLPSSSTSGP